MLIFFSFSLDGLTESSTKREMVGLFSPFFQLNAEVAVLLKHEPTISGDKGQIPLCIFRKFWVSKETEQEIVVCGTNQTSEAF